jgi:hypothetical protein
MSDSSVLVRQNSTGDRPIDNEAVAGHPDGTAYRQRIQIAGATLPEIAEVTSNPALPGAYGLVTRPLPCAVSSTSFISRHMTDDGTPTGTLDAIGDYSDGGLGETQFFITPGAGKKMVIARMLIAVVDSGSFDSGKYGNNITLTNGIKVQVRDGDTTVDNDLTNSTPVKTNVDWATFCYDVNISSFGSGNEYLNVRWTFAKAERSLLLSDDERLTLVLNDSFSGLVGHFFIAQGYWVVGP